MTIWSPEIEEAGPVYLAITRALEGDIARGRLAPGDRLPTHRDLAAELGVNVGTITRAYGEARRRGLIEGEVGRGTYVREPSRSALSRVEPERDRGPVDLSINVPLALSAPDLAGTLLSMASEDRAQPGTLEDVMAYQEPIGSLALREAGANWLGRLGVVVGAEQVVVCAGAQHGILTALAAVAGPGDLVLGEALTYPGFLASARLLGLRVRGVPLDHEGIIPEALEEICRTERPRLLYCMPGLQNPTCVELSAERRRSIADIAERFDLMLIQDEVHGGLVPDGSPSLASLAPNRVFTIASLSKTLSPGIRIAFLAAPPSHLPRLTEVLWASIWMSSPIGGELARRWLQDDVLEDFLSNRREAVARRREMAIDALSDFEIQTHPAAYHCWLGLPEGWDNASAAAALLAAGVRISTADDFRIEGTAPVSAIRISLTATRSQERLAEGLEILHAVLAKGRTRKAFV